MGTILIILGIAAFAIIALVLLFFIANFFKLWLRGFLSQADVGMFQMIGMLLRKIPPDIILDARILSCRAKIPVDTHFLEAHYMSGGNVFLLVETLITAKNGGIRLETEEAAALCLSTKNPLETIRQRIASRAENF